MVGRPLRTPFDKLRVTAPYFFSSLPTGRVRMDGVVAGRGFFVLQAYITQNPFLPFPREGIAQCPGFYMLLA